MSIALSVIALIIAVVVPLVTFRLALRQDQVRWLREQRTQLYVDMLTEAYAEEQWLEYTMADDEARERMRFADLRMPPVERARLGARGTAYGSKAVNKAYNSLGPAAFQAMLKRDISEADRMRTRVQLAGWREGLEKAIRDELGADDIQLVGTLGWAEQALRAGWRAAGPQQRPAAGATQRAGSAAATSPAWSRPRTGARPRHGHRP